MFVYIPEGCRVPTGLPTMIAGQFAWAPIETWASIAAGATECAARAVVRASTPLDVAENLAEFTRVATGAPTGALDAPRSSALAIALLLVCSAPSGTTAVPAGLVDRGVLADSPTPSACGRTLSGGS